VALGNVCEWSRAGYRISTDPARIDLDVVTTYLAEESYWARGVPRGTVAKSIEQAVVFGIYSDPGPQVGFGRVISDLATIAFVSDVFVLEDHRGQGLSKWLMECMMAHPELQGMRRWLLVTRDAHSLYSRYGFKSLEAPARFMEIRHANAYGRAANH